MHWVVEETYVEQLNAVIAAAPNDIGKPIFSFQNEWDVTGEAASIITRGFRIRILQRT
jgi:hypothetical protein